MQDRFYGMLGITAKAGAAASGAYAAQAAVREGKAFLMIIASDASEQTRRDYEKLCAGYGVPAAVYGTMESLGRAIGKDVRAVIAVTDERLAENLLSRIS
ncbi:MAG: ribosomal L7Ae/L30e/S12e/Gadd45 family protein [Lachnospiraceae bacterium]|nr:ribosomal L7Ae/L30e/S12e/Gadd45 family protein [Lachnospiraceae bacterium]